MQSIKKSNFKFLDVNIFTPLHKRIFVTVLFMSTIVTAVEIILNVALGLNEYLTWFYILCFVFSVVILYLSNKSKSDALSKYYYVYWIGIFAVLPVVWILGGGIDGSLMILFILIYIGFFLTTKEKREIVLLISVLFIVGLILLDFYFPDLIVRFEHKTQRYTYLIKAFVVYLIFIHYLLEFVLYQNKLEHKRLETINKRLNSSIKENKILNEKLETYIKELQNVNVSKDRFISIIAHDLRSPFQGLLGVSRLLKESYSDLSDNDKKQLIEKLNNLVEKQYAFLEELLLWGRLQKSVVNLKLENVSIKEILLSVIANFNHQIEKKKLNVKLFDSAETEIKTDRNLLSAVFRNVLSNAIKFSPIGQTIEIFVEYDEKKCLIKFKDYGVGISEEDLPNIFQLDKKVSRRGTEGETGSGFGLILCNEIMTKLNGKIHIESKEGVGTIVTIEIPIVD